jgi:hypothetical protein
MRVDENKTPRIHQSKAMEMPEVTVRITGTTTYIITLRQKVTTLVLKEEKEVETNEPKSGELVPGKRD